MFDFGEICKGYRDEQYAEALYQTLTNYLYFKGIIDIEELVKFQNENFPKLLEKIVERDKAEAKRALEQYKKKNEG